MYKKKFFFKIVSLLLIILMSGNIVNASSKKYEASNRDFSSDKTLRDAKEYMDKGANKQDFDSGMSIKISDQTNSDGSRTVKSMEKNHNGVYTITERTTYPPGEDKEDRERYRDPKPAPPPRPSDEVIIESKTDSTVIWTEREWVFDEGSNSWNPVNYKYRIDLLVTSNIFDSDNKQKNNVTIKAGYGLKVEVSSKFELKQIEGTSRTSTAGFTQTLPTKGTVTTEFAVKKNIAQNKTLSLESKGSGNFTTGKNSGSKTGAKVIYTDISQKDGKYNIVVSLADAKLSGSILGEHIMSNSNTLNFNIKGSMYEDSYVRPTDNNKNKNNSGFNNSFSNPFGN